jgi:hypothetical protein
MIMDDNLLILGFAGTWIQLMGLLIQNWREHGNIWRSIGKIEGVINNAKKTKAG